MAAGQQNGTLWPTANGQRLTTELSQINPQLIFSETQLTILAHTTVMLCPADSLRVYLQAYVAGIGFNTQSKVQVSTDLNILNNEGADIGGHPMMYGMMYADFGICVQQEYWIANIGTSTQNINITILRAQQ